MAEYPDVTVRETTYRVQKLNQQDLDRNFALATSNILKWMQAARMDMPWMQAGYRALSQLNPAITRRLLVGSQMIRLARPGALTEAVDSEVSTNCELGAVGRTTVEFRYKIFFGSRLVGTGLTTMIVTSGTPGNFKASSVPEDVRKIAITEDAGGDRAFMMESLAAVAKEAPSGAYTIPLVIRHSDEDVNKHANHSASARFFEDAKEVLLADESADPQLRGIAEQQLVAIMISYVGEARALDVCEVKVATSGAGFLDVWVYRTQTNRFGDLPRLVTYGRMVCGGGKAESVDTRRLRSSL